MYYEVVKFLVESIIKLKLKTGNTILGLLGTD